MSDIKVDINYGSIDRRCKKSIEQAQLWLDNEIVADTSPYVPFMTGDLSKSARVVEAGKIEYNTPYARKMYHGDGLHFNKTHNPLAGAYWFERSLAVNRGKWVNGVQKIMKGV